MKVFSIAWLPSQQPLVNGRQRQHFQQQPDSQREEDEGERLDKQMEADVKQGAGQLLRREAVGPSSENMMGLHPGCFCKRITSLTSVFSDRPLLKKMSETAT